jgi:branched-chain amino acid transport system ATP-binding protein
MLKLMNINVSIGLIKILHDVSFDVVEHECVALLGSNGAGKSTTLKTISGLIRQNSGDIIMNDKSIANISAAERVKLGIVQVPEGGRVFPYLTVEENLNMGASGTQQSWKSRKDSIEKVFSLFPILRERRSLPARSLSGGERQMLAIGRGLMAKPSLLMIDEPSIGLAPKILIEIYATLRSLHDSGVTILLSEQNVQKALSLANRGYVMENGRIVMEGTRSELLNSEHVKTAYLGV